MARRLKADIVRDADSSITLLFERSVRAGKKVMAGPDEARPVRRAFRDRQLPKYAQIAKNFGPKKYAAKCAKLLLGFQDDI
jgi:hypothetical protein